METLRMDPEKHPHSRHALRGLLAALILGLASGIAIIPALFKFMPGDASRNRTILQHIRTQKEALPNACFLGSSVVMNGINTRLLSDPELTVWNFSSPGQKLLESALILAQTPSSYQTVLVGTSATSLCAKKKDMSDNKVTAYMMYGYALPESYLDLARAVDAGNLIKASRDSYLQNVVKGRWIVKNGLDMWIRNMLRRDLDLKRSEKDMFHPSPYKTKVDSETLQLLLERYCHKPRQASGATITRESKLILKYMAEQLEKRNGRLVVVILPEHPAKQQVTEADYYAHFQEQLLQLQKELRVEIINLIDLLTHEQFIDHVHPDHVGAELLTSEIASYLR